MLDMSTLSLCAPEISGDTLQKIIMVESGGNPFAVNVNKLLSKQQPKPSNIQEAVEATKYWIGLGYSVDVGLMQVNSQHFSAFGLNKTTLLKVFEPCSNVRYGAQILLKAWQSTDVTESKKDRLMRSLSIYNTGNSIDGFKNGYVQKYSLKGIVKTKEKTITPFNSNTDVGFDAIKFYGDDL